jgi:hypothetical protein
LAIGHYKEGMISDKDADAIIDYSTWTAARMRAAIDELRALLTATEATHVDRVIFERFPQHARRSPGLGIGVRRCPPPRDQLDDCPVPSPGVPP